VKAAALAVCAWIAAGCSDGNVLRLWLGGDVHLGVGGRDVLSRLDVAGAGIVNLEGPVGAQPDGGERLRLANAPESLAELRAAGVRVVGVANNHARDLGDAGAAATIDAVRAAGLVPSGGAAGPARFDAGGVSVVVTAHDLGAGPPSREELAAARSGADVLVATFHVTAPASYVPVSALREAARLALDAGAAVVAAHGTHTLAAIERRDGALVAWGLGNLTFACDCTDESDGLVLRVTVGRDGLRDAEVVPVRAGLGGDAVEPAPNAALLYDLLEAIGSNALERNGASARVTSRRVSE
jgi:poly-gamma-glutamate capsule biosynthesis protein CapA/YwtB (metallophosphatase superfamily)